MNPIFFALITAIACSIICYFIAKKKGSKTSFWSAVGFAMGPFAIAFVFLAGPVRKAKMQSSAAQLQSQ